MEAVVKKYQSKYRKVKEDMARWDDLQSCLLSQFGNATTIIERLPKLMDIKNFGALRHISGIKEELTMKQLIDLERIFSSMKDTMKEFHGIVKSLEKVSRDCHQQLKGGSSMTTYHMHLRIGILPSLQMCLDGLKAIYEMYHSEYILKGSLISSLTVKSSSDTIYEVRRLLADQANIPKHEVLRIFETILPGELSS